MKAALFKFLKPIASLKLTVALLIASVVLVFAGTWAQIDDGIWDVQKQYFHSFFVWVRFQLFFPRPNPGQPGVPGGFPMLGGYSLIALLLVNLLAAHTVRFKVNRKRIGILLIHAGIILLILGEVVSSVFQVEGQMRLDEGETHSYAQDIRHAELAVIDPSPADRDDVTVIPASRLVVGTSVGDKSLPISLRIERYYKNSITLGPFQAQQARVAERPLATAGEMKDVVVIPQAEFPGTDASAVDVPAALVEVLSGTDSLGKYVLSPTIDRPQSVVVNGKTYWLALRFVRDYKPYSITLLDFRHDKFVGTEKPRNFSSEVRLVDRDKKEDRQALIRMNEPLRHRGETIYQAGFDRALPTVTTLMIVRNPGWLIPYISCSMVGLGMIVHFGAILWTFLGRQNSTTPTEKRKPSKSNLDAKSGGFLWPALGATACALYLGSSIAPPRNLNTFDINSFARIPISYEGRVMPLDSLARNSLRIISGKSEVRSDGKTLPAINWLADTFADPQRQQQHPIFRIDHPDVKSLLALDASRKLFSFAEIQPGLRKFQEQYQRVHETPRADRTLFQRKVNEVADHILLYMRLVGVETLYVAPPDSSSDDWKTFGEVAGQNPAASTNPSAIAFAGMLSAYGRADAGEFNSTVAGYLAGLETRLPAITTRAGIEVAFNRLDPFYHLMVIYVVAFVLICCSWLGARSTLTRAAYWILITALIAHTLALVGRIYISGRPPVTNLYGSAIFIAWGVAVFCAVLERIYRNGIGTLAAAIAAFPSLLIAHYLAGSGDTMEMLQAVLDTNFWLATHVIIITLGYAATFLAGVLAIIYILAGIFTRYLERTETAKTIARMIYGVLCFAMLFSFIGTVLGGIWADQSWGRFWGWDPKENGAVLIVLWNAVILHARWGGIVQARGIAQLAIFGNAVTSFSWFGTNMLGVGLHSYGFMDSALMWLGLFVISQIALIALGGLPLEMWRSFRSMKHKAATDEPARSGKPSLAR